MELEMNPLAEEITSLIDLCKQEFNIALRRYQASPYMGWIVGDQEFSNIQTRATQIIDRFPEQENNIKSWLESLAPFRRNGILDNYSECMQAIESLQKIIS